MRCGNAPDEKTDGGYPAGNGKLQGPAYPVSACASVSPARSETNTYTSEKGDGNP